MICVQGNIVRQLGDLNLATFCIHQLAELDVKNCQNVSALQLSLVHSFLKNYDKVLYTSVLSVSLF